MQTLFMFMPFFFFKSGMFFHEDAGIKKVFKSGWKRLMVPYLAFSFVGWLMFLVRDVLNDGFAALTVQSMLVSPLRNIFHEGAVAANSPLWFLPSLFAVKLLSAKLLNRKTSFLFISATGLLAFLLNYVGLDTYFYVSNICSGCFFYGVGFLLKESQYRKATFLASIVAYIGIVIFIPTYVDMRSNHCSHGSYLAYLFSATAGVIVFNNVARLPWLRPICSPLEVVGRESMVIYVSHWPVLCFAHIVVSHSVSGEVANWTWFAIYAIALALIMPLLDILLKQQRMRWALGL